MAKKRGGSTNVEALRRQNKALGEKLRAIKAAKKLKVEIAKKQKAISGLGSTGRKRR
jgi:hypothetical protein